MTPFVGFEIPIRRNGLIGAALGYATRTSFKTDTPSGQVDGSISYESLLTNIYVPIHFNPHITLLPISYNPGSFESKSSLTTNSDFALGGSGRFIF